MKNSSKVGSLVSPAPSKSNDWIAANDDMGNKYYYNSSTGESRWHLSEGMSVAGGEETPSKANGGSSFTPRSETTEWHQEFDNTMNHNYYVNSKTGVAQWNTPSKSVGKSLGSVRSNATSVNNHWHQEVDENTGENYYYNSKTAEAQWDTPNRMNTSWHKEFDDNTNHNYYYNSKTGETQWNTPAKLKQQQQQQYSDYNANNTPGRSVASWHKEFDENIQSKYYYNSKTGESQWDTPARLKQRQSSIEYNTNDGNNYNNFDENSNNKDTFN